MGAWPLSSDLLSCPMASPLRLSLYTTSALSLSPPPASKLVLPYTKPSRARTAEGSLSSRYLFIPHWEVQLAIMMEEPELLAEEAEDEMGTCILPLHEANQCSAQGCPQVWSPVVSQQQ